MIRVLRVVAVAFVPLLAANCASQGPEEPPARATVRGLVTIDPEGTTLRECRSKKTITLGTMSVRDTLYLERRYRELGGPKADVTAELTGFIKRTRDGGELAQPTLSWLAPGYCKAPVDHSWDYK